VDDVRAGQDAAGGGYSPAAGRCRQGQTRHRRGRGPRVDVEFQTVLVAFTFCKLV
jgi:hypothetical protein